MAKDWIKKAVNPKHKGYCTPMTKPTCTPRRKALAKRFKAMAKKQEGGVIVNDKKLDSIKDNFTPPGSKTSRKDYINLKKQFDIQKKAIGKNDTKKLEELKLGKSFNINDLIKTYHDLQGMRKDLNLGVSEEINLVFPFVGQQIRGRFNQILGTHFKEGGKLSKEYIKEAREKAGGSNVGKKTFSDGSKRTGPYIGTSGGAPKGSYPIPDLKHAKAALSLAHNAPNPEGIKKAVYNKFPELKKHANGGIIDISKILIIWKG